MSASVHRLPSETTRKAARALLEAAPTSPPPRAVNALTEALEAGEEIPHGVVLALARAVLRPDTGIDGPTRVRAARALGAWPCMETDVLALTAVFDHKSPVVVIEAAAAYLVGRDLSHQVIAAFLRAARRRRSLRFGPVGELLSRHILPGPPLPETSR